MLFQNIFATAYLKFFFEEKLIANLMQKQEQRDEKQKCENIAKKKIGNTGIELNLQMNGLSKKHL